MLADLADVVAGGELEGLLTWAQNSELFPHVSEVRALEVELLAVLYWFMREPTESGVDMMEISHVECLMGWWALFSIWQALAAEDRQVRDYCRHRSGCWMPIVIWTSGYQVCQHWKPDIS